VKLSLSIKDAWYGLILLVAFLPFVILLMWGGFVFHNILLDKSLKHEKVYQDLLRISAVQEISRLTSVLENKSDPMAYTLSHQKDEVLLSGLLKKVISRESSIHVLMLLKPDGQIITGRKNSVVGASDEAELQDHLDSISITKILTVTLNGEPYMASTAIHSEGVYLTIAVPVANAEKALGVLVAEIDVTIMWNSISNYISLAETTSYIVDAKGKLLIEPEVGQYHVGDDVSNLPLVKSIENEQPWPVKQSYIGIGGKQVYGTSLQIEDLGWQIVTEINQQSILQPIWELIFKLVVTAVVIIVLFLIFGMYLVRRIVNAIRLISYDFERIGKQDFRPSTIVSNLIELESMVTGFNRMVKEIARKQQALNQAAIVFDNTSEGIMITDAKARIVSVNSAFTDITGYSEEEVIGKNPSLLQSGRQDESFYVQMWQSIGKNGRWRGEVENRRKNGSFYTELLSINSFKGEQNNIVQYVGVITDISSIKDTEHKLEHLAHHDPLTELPNRLLCNARLQHELQVALRHEEMVAVMFLDLDMFKNINDSLGHAMGDLLLQKVALRINECIRDEDTLSRLGGDEFVLIIGSLKSKSGVEQFSENILDLFSRSFAIGEHEVFIGVSIGISVFPEDGRDADTLLRNADAAMYRAKAEGRNNSQFYTQDLTRNAGERLSMETYLRHALENNELVLHYQPQYSLKTGQMVAVEALIRWQHPEQGLIYPDKFITIAEETGLIVPIGEWVLETACDQLIKWQNTGCLALRMAVNLSARQFWKPGLEKIVRDILIKTGVEPSLLDLELTESIIMRDTKSTAETLNEFHAMGIELSIDDFGTGYSSLSYLKRFPINRLKIDKSFVCDIAIEKNGDDMINSIIALGHCMGLQVLAEGVETEEQLTYLRENGCDEVQGYYYSRPIPADELEELCKKS